MPEQVKDAPPIPLDLQHLYRMPPGARYGKSAVDDIDMLIERIASLEARVREAQRLAFVEGAKWWEWHEENATIWPSDQQLAYERALEKYPEPTTFARPEPVRDEPTDPEPASQ